MKLLVYAFPLVVAINHCFDFVFNNNHVIINDKSAHAVIGQANIPFSPHFQVETGVQEIVNFVSHSLEAHSNQICRELTLKAFLDRLILHCHRCLIKSRIEGRKLLRLLSEKLLEA